MFPSFFPQVMMALIPFETMLECLQSPHSLSGRILSGQEGLHYGDVCYMSMHHMPLMQCIPYHYFNNITPAHTVPHPNTRINPTKTKKMASPHANAWLLQCRGPPPCGQKRSPSLKNLPWSSMPHPEAITSASQMSNSPSPA